ncbi:MAG: protein phosphatase 2C domain-containing protein [Vulcanococcus sp.]|uniref:protein phosphatase 2C domain-containing protein n=1 Tax=Vulcanococcus sp. TaxID=2856995 RepID=UPI0025D3B59F|nr:protein phosphatase 2C domain-containing protein [Vulcanococcus sp.]MBW0174434.1 protein phosphatase 2C domain-containing protein [Vulcanococcus sp.]MBW0180536.1 protein phosphatase 2C domain-containing protein [Vulcanococcus sp.]
MNPRWQHLQACSVIGAAHRRQQKPCQDASLSVELKGRGGSLQLLVVADGHGGSRYRLSHRGSALACQVSQEAVEQWLSSTPLTEPERWRQLLEQELPAAIHQRWLAAITADWALRPGAEHEPFSPLLYGSTLGLVLLAPQWWGCTGIGDWDLSAIDQQGQAALLSEEREHSGSEATGSLCQTFVQQLWRERTQLHPLEPHTDLQALVLSTDGVRKSCATDADYLQLCAALLDVRDRQELEQGLAHITQAGSGDDVSLAIAHRASKPKRSSVLPRGWRWLLLLLAASGVGLAAWLVTRQETPLQAEARQLCANPEQIQATLNQRRAQFKALLNQPQLASQLQQLASTDPLGALIAASQSGPIPGCTALNAELNRQWQRARATAVPAKGKMPAAAPPAAAPRNP